MSQMNQKLVHYMTQTVKERKKNEISLFGHTTSTNIQKINLKN